MELTVSLKTSWHQVSLSDFNKIIQIQKDSNLEEFEKNIKILTVLTDLTEEQLELMPVSDVKDLITKTSFLNEDVPTVPLKKRYTINGKKYFLIQNIHKLTGAQFVDLTSFLKDPSEVENNLAWIIAILLLPIRKKYLVFNKTEKYSETELEIIKDSVLQMSFVDVKAISDFFLSITKIFAETTISYMGSQISHQLMSALKILNEKKNQTEQEKELVAQINHLLASGTGFM